MDDFPIKKISQGDAEYPAGLGRLHDAPKFFYCRGRAQALARPSVAVVGTRRTSEHGLIVARDFSESFSRAGLTVVSGLAFGIDAAAHEGALMGGSPTVAVLGSGTDDASIYPRANFPLARRILESGGAIISENPAGTRPREWDFPKRNRLIAALSRVTVVVEAPVRSGAVITAKYALELGSEVYAVPADALRESAFGSNGLILDGAVPLLNPDRVIEDLVGEQAELAPPVALANETEAAVVEALKKGSTHADELSAVTGLTPQALMAVLSALELRGIIVNMGGMRHGLAASRPARRK